MEKMPISKTVAAKPTDWKAAVIEGIAEIARANARMEHRQVEIAKLKAETRAILDELKAA